MSERVITVIQAWSGGPAVEWLARALRGERHLAHVVLPVASYPEIAELEKHARRGTWRRRIPHAFHGASTLPARAGSILPAG